MQAKANKLLAVNFIEEAKYSRCVSNIVVVPKKNGKSRMCIDFTDLDKACPMHPYPMPYIYDLVDATTGHE